MLSAAHVLSDVRYWALLCTLSAISSAALLAWWKPGGSFTEFRLSFRPPRVVVGEAWRWYRHALSWYERLGLAILSATVLLAAILNLVLIFSTAPHNWDSMTYHLARMAYYLQHDTLASFDANYWAQVTHPKNGTLMLIYAYVVSGGQEHLTQLVQFISYWIAVCSVYAISRRSGQDAARSIFAALLTALLTNWLMEASTTQNDLILTALLGCAVYFLLAFKTSGEFKYVNLMSLAVALSLGTKESAVLFLPPLAVVATYVLLTSSRDRVRHAAKMSVSLTIATMVWALPSGYVDNYLDYGHLLGPQDVADAHTFRGEPLPYIASNSAKNLVRFGFDFMSLDGAPPVAALQKAQASIKRGIHNSLVATGIDLQTGTREPFDVARAPHAQEELSYWGVFGIALIWPALLAAFVRRNTTAELRVLSVAALMFVVTQALAGPYDPWRGRYFTAAAIFAVPATGLFVRARRTLTRSYVLVVLAVGCLFATTAVTLREQGVLFSLRHKRTILTLDRIAQLTANRQEYTEPIRRFSAIVPTDATVALSLDGDSYEYPLFGERLTRKLLPINPLSGPKPIPAEAQYLLYSDTTFACPSAADIYLGADWFLRRLTDANRRCS